MQENFNDSLFEYSIDFFQDYISDLFKKLFKNNERYKKLNDKTNKILKNHQNIRSIINRKQASISEEESKYFIDYINNITEMSFMENEEIFFAGFKEAYYYFKRCGLINEERYDNNKKNT